MILMILFIVPRFSVIVTAGRLGPRGAEIEDSHHGQAQTTDEGADMKRLRQDVGHASGGIIVEKHTGPGEQDAHAGEMEKPRSSHGGLGEGLEGEFFDGDERPQGADDADQQEESGSSEAESEAPAEAPAEVSEAA